MRFRATKESGHERFLEKRETQKSDPKSLTYYCPKAFTNSLAQEKQEEERLSRK